MMASLTIASISGGTGSYLAARRYVDQHGTDDWPNRKAVYEHRAPWNETISVHIVPAALAEHDGREG